MRLFPERIIVWLCLLGVGLISGHTASAQKVAKQTASLAPVPVLWLDPGDVGRRDLRYGSGSAKLAPSAPFTFIEEAKGGVSPKFDVRDAKGVVWRVKLGEEAQSETVATRLVWAVGYFAEEAYYHQRVRINGLPRLSRGREFVEGKEYVRGARFEPRRKKDERGPAWDWEKNPFVNTQTLNGLKVLMVLLNNYDVRTENNAILYTGTGRSRQARYYVSDLGATLGKAGGLGGTRSKNNLKDFVSTRFVLGVRNDREVVFDFDTRPAGFGVISILYPPYYKSQVKKERSMRGVPIEHARWIGKLLSQLSDRQLHDAFVAAGYDQPTRNGFVAALRVKINELTDLNHFQIAGR